MIARLRRKSQLRQRKEYDMPLWEPSEYMEPDLDEAELAELKQIKAEEFTWADVCHTCHGRCTCEVGDVSYDLWSQLGSDRWP